MIMTIRKYTILFFFLLTSFLYAGYNDLVFTPYFQYPNSGAPIVGTYNIAIGFVTENYYSDSFVCPYLNFDVVDGEMICTVNQEVNITDGFATIVLDNMTNLDAFKTPRLQPKFFKEISGDYTAIQPSDNDFLFNSSAFSIMSYKSAYIVFPQAEKLAETSEFDNSFVIDAGLDLGFMRFSKTRPYWSNKSSNDNQYDVDVSVSINVDTNYFKNGIPLSQTLLWSTSSSSDGLYTLDSVHINGVVNYELGVNGTVLAHDYYWGDSSIDLLSSWVTANAGADYLYYEATTKNVGFGVSSLEERVNVAGLLLMEYGEPVTSTGSIYVKNGDFMGVVDLSDGSGGFEAVTLNALQVLGQPNQVAFFSDYRTLDSDSDLAIYSSDAAISIFDLSGGPVRIQDDFVVVSADNTILFGVNSGLGNFVITNNNDQVNFILSGGFEAEDYYLNGLPIYLQMAQGEYFYKNPILSSVDNYVVYYDRGHIVLGRSESSDSKAVLEISNPYLDPSLPVIDPAISFVREDVSDSNNNTVFSMGVSNRFNDQFVVVDGYDLNVGTPLLVVKRDYLGVGVSQPKASLSISGNTGIMIQGDLKFFDDVSRVDVISAFDEPGLKMYFNPYSAAFRVGEFFASENYYQNVGVFSAAIGVASQVSGNLSSALGGIRNDVSGIYSTAIGGFSNNISQGFSLGLGIGSQIDHDGSFVFSHGGYYAGNSYNNIDNFLEISEGDRFKTADSRQFLIGAPSPSYLGTSFGINTNNTSGILTVKAQTILPSVLEDKLSLSLSEANTLFDLLVDNDFLDSVGNLNVYDKRAFNDYYTLDDFPIIVSINSVEVFNTLVATINNHDLSGVVTSSNLKEWGVISQSHWEAYYSPNFDTGAASTFVDSAGDGLHLLFVDMTVDDTVGTILDQLVFDGVLDDQKTFYGCTFDGSQYDYNGNTYGETSTENLIIEIILNTYPSVVDGKIMTDYSANFSTSNLQELMSAVLDQDGVTCDDFDSKMIAAEDLSDKIKEVDVDTVEMPFDDIDTCGTNSQAVECKYTYVAYKYYLDNTIYPDLFVKIRNDIDSNVFDLDMVSSGSYLISDFDETYSSDLAAISTTLTTTNVQAVLQELATANIITLRGTNKESRFHVQNDGMVGVGYDVVDRADLAVNGMTYISHSDVTDFVTTPALLVIDNLYDSTEDDTEQSLYPDSLVVRKDLEDYVPTPVFMINSSGIVGIGDVVSSADKNFSLVSMGSIHAGGLTTPAGDISPEVVIVFQWDELTTPNIYFVDGFLGLGLVSPNRPQSLLHLTYYNGNSIPQPVLSFDYNDEELVKLGGMAPSSAGFRIAKAESLYTDPAFFVSSDVGAMNMPGFFSDEPGVVSGSFGVNSGVMLVNTDNQRQDVGASFVTNEFHTKSFYLKQDSGFAKVTSSGFPWNFDHDNNNIFLNDGSRIGIGTSEPQYDLDVSGNFAFISTDEILTVENRLFVDELYLTTKNYAVADDIYLKFSDPIFDNVGLLVRSQDLFLRFGSLDINQTDQLKYGSGKCGDLVLLNVMNVNEVFGSLYYDPEGTQLCGQSSNGYPSENVNFVFDFNDVTNNYWTYDDSLEVWTVVDSSDAVITDNMSQFIITGSVDIQLDNQVNGFATVNNNFVFPYSLNSNYYGVYFNSTIRYDGDFWNDSFSHSFTSLNIRIVSNNNNNVDEADYIVKGLDISIDNIDQTGHIKTLDDRAQVIGLSSDLTNVNAQESGESISGYRFPAIFFGDVLISTSNRNAVVSRDLDILINDDKMPLLSIKGTLKADALVISDALYSPTLFVNAGYQKSFNVGNNGDAVLPRPRVGINVLEPTVELDIAGNVKADTIQVGVLNSNFIDHQDNKFVVLENGFVGFGKTERFVNEQVLFYKLFNSYQTGLFDYKSYHFDIDSDPDVTTDFTGLGIEIFTSENNYVGLDVPVVVKGMDIDLTGITNMDTAVLTGVYSDVTANSHSYAAVFLSANVGIGVLEPEVALHINGDIRTNDYDGISNYLTTMDNFGVGDLVVTGSAFMNHVVANRVSVNSLILMPGIDFDFDTMVATDNQSVSLNLNVNNSLSVVTLNNVTILTVQNDMIIDHLEVVSGSVSNRVRLDLEDITYDFDVDLALQSSSIDTDTLDVGSIIVANNQYYDNNYVPILRVDDGYFYVNDTVPEQYRHPVSVRVDVTTNVVDRGDGNQSSFVPNNVRSWNSMGLFSGVTDNETYVALSLYPHADHLQNWVLLSKLWKSHVNSELNLTHSELDLAFYNFENDVDKAGNFTSPNVSGAFVAPELYVSSNGQVLLFPNQLDFRDYANHTLFNVYGTARFVNSDGDYSLLPTVKMTTLNVTTINHTGLITIGKIRDNIYINNDVVVSDNVFVENGINMEYMDPYDNRINQEESIALYVVSKNNQSDIHINLNVQGKVVSTNLMDSVATRANSVLVFSDGGIVTPSSLMVTDNTEVGNAYVTFHDASTSNRVLLRSFVSDSNINSDLVTFQRIDASVHNSLSGSRYIKGLDLVLKDKSGDAADKIVGLDVSMNVSANTFSVFTGDVLTMADKYSAVFNGGSVLIVSDNLVMPIQPSANLYIASQNNMRDLASMIVSNGSFYPFIVSGNKVGFGGDSSSSLGGLFELDVHNSDLDSEDSVFTIKDNGTVLVDFVITNNDSILLDLDRFENSSAANFKSLETDRLSIDSGDIFFFDYDKEFVGMKVATPLAHFHAHDILSAEAVNKDRKIIKVDVASDNFQYDITGYDIDLSVADNNVLNGDVTGFVVDMTNFSVHDQSTIYGLWVDVTSNETETASSLVIVTGSVGIGFTEPRGVLDIDGVLFVKNDVKTPSSSIVIDAELATVNKLDVLGGININSDVHWSNVSINQELRFNNIFTPVGELVDFDYSAFLSADQILFRDTMDMRSGVSGTLFVSNNLLVGTETANFHSDQSIFIDTGSNKVAYFSDLIVKDDVFVIDEFIKPLDTSGVFYFDSDVTFNEGVINRLEVPYFSFGNNTNSRAYSLTVSSNSLWYQGIKLVIVTADNGLIPISAGVEGLIATDSFRIVTRDSVNMYSSQDHDVVEISGNVEINALIDDLNDFPSNGLQSFEGTLMYRSPSLTDVKLSMTGLKVNITSGNNHSGSFVYEGVSVDMTTLLADYYSDYDVVADIGKYAAVFEGGRVAIIASASDTVIPTPEMVDVYVSANFDHRTGHRDFFVEFDESSNEGYGFGVFATSNTLFVDIGESRNLNTILTSGYMVRVVSDNSNLMKIAESGQDLFLIKNDTVFIGNNFDDISDLSLYVKAYNPDDVLVSMEGLYIDNGVAIISNNIKTIADRVAVLDFMMDGSSQEYFKLSDASNTYASINTQFVIGAGSNLTNIPSNSFKLVLVSDNVTAPFFVGPSDDVVTHSVNDEIGYIVANKDDNSFVSMFAMPSVNADSHVSHNRILFGSESLVIEAVDALKPALTIQEDSVGIFTDSSLLSDLVVDNLFSGQDYFLVVSSNSNYANLLVDEAGKVGIGVLVNENLGAELTVKGTVQVDTVENNDTGSGTYLSVNGPLEISAGDLIGEAHNLNFAVTVNRSEEFSAYSVTTVLDMDAYNFNIADKRIIMKDDSSKIGSNGSAWGVYVDVTSMDAKTVEGSYKYSGIFYGKTDGVLDSKFVIDNSDKDYDGWYTHHAKKKDDGTLACVKDQLAGTHDLDDTFQSIQNYNNLLTSVVGYDANAVSSVNPVSVENFDFYEAGDFEFTDEATWLKSVEVPTDPIAWESYSNGFYQMTSDSPGNVTFNVELSDCESNTQCTISSISVQHSNSGFTEDETIQINYGGNSFGVTVNEVATYSCINDTGCGSGSGARLFITVDSAAAAITAVDITNNGGSGYSTNDMILVPSFNYGSNDAYSLEVTQINSDLIIDYHNSISTAQEAIDRFGDMDRQTDCLKNINYFYPLTVIASSNIDVGVDLVSFSTLDSQGVSFNLITGGTTPINKQFSDGAGLADYKSMITGPSFINTVPFSPANVLVLQQHLNTIYEELTRVEIIDSHGQVDVDKVDLESLLNLNLPMVDDNNTIEKNVLAVLENFVTQNVFFVKQTLAYDSNNNSIKTRDNICVVEGNIWGIDDPNFSNGDCAHTDFIAQDYDYQNGEGIMYPLAFSTGFDPIYMQPYNVARVGINLVTTSDSFIKEEIEFTETLVIGDGAVGTPSSNYDYREEIPTPLSTDPINSIGNKYCNGNDCTVNGPGTWTTDYGFHTDLADFAIQYGNSLIADNIHEYVETDQHSVTVRSLGNGNTKYRYMSYKTRYSDVRVGQYMPQSSFGDSNSFDAKVFFSGGTCISTALSDKDNCSDNDDIFTMGRENPLPLITSEPGEAFESTSYASYFRVDMTELDTSVKDIQFQIGFMDSSDIFTSPLVVGADLGTTFVGIGSLWNEQVRPKALLHVKDYSSFLVGTSSFDYLKTSGLSSERFVFGSNSLIETQFDSIQHSVDQFGIPTNIRSAAEEGAGCDGDYRIYNNREVWENTFECEKSGNDWFCKDATETVDYVDGGEGKTFGREILKIKDGDSGDWDERDEADPSNFRNHFATYDPDSSASNLNMDTYGGGPNIDQLNDRETVYSCHYYAWLVSEVLGLSFNDVPSTTNYLEMVTTDPQVGANNVVVVIDDWETFVDNWNAGHFIEHLEARDVQNAAALKLSSSLTRFVPKAHSSVWSAASVVTTFDNGNYLNYSSMDDTNCRIIDWAGYNSTDEGPVVGARSIDTADTANLTPAQKANMLALMDATESKDDDYIATLDEVRVVNICATTMVNPVKIIRGSNTGYVFNDDDYLSRFEAVDIGQNLLALNYPQATLSEGTNFAAFFSGSGLVDQLALGEIEGLGDDLSGIRGIQFSSPGRDYAEYMLKKDANQVMEPGDVVGVFGGELSFETEGADTVMVISSAPIIVGNFPGNDVKHLYELVAFLGQVPVKVSGKVTAGDILVVSGHGDGLAIAVAEDDLVASQLPFIIGRAWEGYEGEDVAYVNTLIGFSFNVEIINRYIEKAAKKLSHEKDATNQLETKLKSHLKQQQDFIKRLEKALTLNKE